MVYPSGQTKCKSYALMWKVLFKYDMIHISLGIMIKIITALFMAGLFNVMVFRELISIRKVVIDIKSLIFSLESILIEYFIFSENFSIFMFLLTNDKNSVRMLLRIDRMFIYSMNVQYLIIPVMKIYTALALAFHKMLLFFIEMAIKNQILFQLNSIICKFEWEKICFVFEIKIKLKNLTFFSIKIKFSNFKLIILKKTCFLFWINLNENNSCWIMVFVIKCFLKYISKIFYICVTCKKYQFFKTFINTIIQ